MVKKNGDVRLLSPTLKKEKRTAWFFVAPALILIGGVYLYPIIATVVYSVTTINIGTYSIERFVGFGNFRFILFRDSFGPTLFRTLYFGIMVVLLTTTLALIVSLLININFRGNNLLKVIILIPWAVPPVVAGVMWSQMFQYEYGFINALIRVFGGQGDTIWLGTPTLAIHALIIAETWRWLPFATLFIFASLQTIPFSVIEAAAIDGAGYFKTVRKVILPNIMPLLIPVVIFLFVWAMKTFDTIFVLTAGGPRMGTTTLNYSVYLQGFQQFKFGRAAASAYILTFVTIAVIYLLSVLRKKLTSRVET
ncbi:MAG: sugar ABC transporter permease [Candidatus Nanopelagicales bacterium]